MKSLVNGGDLSGLVSGERGRATIDRGSVEMGGDTHRLQVLIVMFTCFSYSIQSAPPTHRCKSSFTKCFCLIIKQDKVNYMNPCGVFSHLLSFNLD